jgi:hypothetical protein
LQIAAPSFQKAFLGAAPAAFKSNSEFDVFVSHEQSRSGMAEMAAKRGLEDGTSKVHEVQCGPVVFHGHQAHTLLAQND